MQLSFLSIVKTIHLMSRRSPFSSTDHGESQRRRQDSAEGAKWTLSFVLNSGAPESWNSVAEGQRISRAEASRPRPPCLLDERTPRGDDR